MYLKFTFLNCYNGMMKSAIPIIKDSARKRLLRTGTSRNSDNRITRDQSQTGTAWRRTGYWGTQGEKVSRAWSRETGISTEEYGNCRTRSGSVQNMIFFSVSL